MRNLKKFLALVLAMIMVVGATAMVSADDFTDVAAEDKYATAINDLAGKEIVKGLPDGSFGVDQKVQRWQMALFIARSATGEVGEEADTGVWANGIVPFEDIAGAAESYKGAIQYASANGIIIGRDAKTFAPNDEITYVEALTMAVRALGVDTKGLEYPYGYYYKAVELGLTANVAVYDVKQALTRGETAQIINNMIYADRADSELTFAAENFDKVVVRTSDLFVITATPKQSYATNYAAASDNNTGAYVGLQPLVNGVPSGELVYVSAAKLGVEDADVEKYLSYSVELVNFDEETGAFDAANIGAAPYVTTSRAVSFVQNQPNKINIAGKVYNIVDNVSGTALKNEIVAFRGGNVGATQAKTLVEDEDGNVYFTVLTDHDNNSATADIEVVTLVATRISFGGSNTKFYAAKVSDADHGIVANSIISESKALEAWGHTTQDVQYTKYSTMTGTQISQLGAYQLEVFDDNNDGLYDRIIANDIFLSVYKTHKAADTDGKIYDWVDNIAADGTTHRIDKITFSDTSVQKTGTMIVYTFNSQLNQVNVLETVKPQTGILTKVDASKLDISTNGKITYTIDGNNYHAFYINDDVNTPAICSNFYFGANLLGANVIENGSVASFAQIAKGNLKASNGFYDIALLPLRTEVQFYAYNGVILTMEAVNNELETSLVVMNGFEDVDDSFENLVVSMYVDGVKKECLVSDILTKDISKLSVWKLSELISADPSYFFPGLVYNVTVNADGEYKLSGDKTGSVEVDLNPAGTDAHLAQFGLVDASAAIDATGAIAFDNGVSTIANNANKIITDKETVFYFINRVGGVESYNTTVRTFIGMPDDASIVTSGDTIVLADYIGLNAKDFANVVIVYDAVSTPGFTVARNDSTYVYVPNALKEVTVAGTAEALELVGEEYEEDEYYLYANAAINLETGAVTRIITSEKLNTTNTNKIYEVDANGVVVAHFAIDGVTPEGAANAYYYSFAEAVANDILAKITDAEVTYHDVKNLVIADTIAGGDVNAIKIADKVTALTAFPILGDLATDFAYNEEVNAVYEGTTQIAPALIDGDEDAYYLKNSLADGNVTILYY